MDPLKIIYYGLFGANLIALLFRGRSLERRHVPFIPLCLLALVTQLIAEPFKGTTYGQSFLFHLYVPLEYMLLCIYYSLLFGRKKITVALIVSALLLVAFNTVFFYTTPRFWLSDYADLVTESLFVTLCVVGFFISLFRSDDQVNLARYPDFWINTGNLFFYASGVFVMGLDHTLRKQNPTLADGLIKINNYLNLLLYLFYLIAFTWAQPTKTSSK
jgi:hypothetical protein